MCRSEVSFVVDGIMLDFECDVDEVAKLIRVKRWHLDRAALPYSILISLQRCENFDQEEERIL